MHGLVWQNLSFYLYLYLFSGMDCGLLPMGLHIHAIVVKKSNLPSGLLCTVYCEISFKISLANFSWIFNFS